MRMHLVPDVRKPISPPALPIALAHHVMHSLEGGVRRTHVRRHGFFPILCLLIVRLLFREYMSFQQFQNSGCKGGNLACTPPLVDPLMVSKVRLPLAASTCNTHRRLALPGASGPAASPPPCQGNKPHQALGAERPCNQATVAPSSRSFPHGPSAPRPPCRPRT